MRIIKPRSTTPEAGAVEVLDFGNLKRQSERVLAAARERASAILTDARADAQREAEAIRDDARRAGHAEGLEAGRAAGEQAARDEVVRSLSDEIGALVEGWTLVLEDLRATRRTMIEEAADDLLLLAGELARRIVGRTIELDGDVATRQVEEAVRLVGGARLKTIVVHPADLERVREHLPTLLETVGGARDVVLQADGTIDRGGCVVRTDDGEVDATIRTQLARLEAALWPRGLGDES